jgi:hypothetical protein
MNVANNSNYNAYPVTASALCVLSYLSSYDIVSGSAITKAVAAANQPGANPFTPLGTQVVWGPAFSPTSGFNTDSLMYIAQVTGSDEYFVVIRGTNPLSIYSWIYEDFNVGTAEQLNTLPGIPAAANMPDDVIISTAAFTGISNLLALTDPATGVSALSFLQGVITATPGAYIYVTGHSLGGTLTPVMYAYLNAVLFNGAANTNMALWSFAGLTAGGTTFNNYFNSLSSNAQTFLWRIQNSLDLAPFFFESELSVRDAYLNENPPLSWTTAELILITGLFADSLQTSIGYAQPQTGYAISGSFANNLSWAAEAGQQHHSTTYYPMVAQAYGY